MKETLPSYEAMMPAVLKVLADGVARSLREVFERVCQHYAFTRHSAPDFHILNGDNDRIVDIKLIKHMNLLECSCIDARLGNNSRHFIGGKNMNLIISAILPPPTQNPLNSCSE